MPTKKPRLHVTLEPDRYALLQRLAALRGVSMARIIAELLDTVATPLERVADTLEAAKKAPDELQEGLRLAIEKAQQTIEKQTRRH